MLAETVIKLKTYCKDHGIVEATVYRDTPICPHCDEVKRAMRRLKAENALITMRRELNEMPQM